MTRTHPALQPLQMNGLSLKNRAVVAPMSRVSATRAGVPTAEMAAYYGELAEGGFGLVIGEGTFPDERFGRGYQHQPGLVDHAQLEGWRQVVSAVHRRGAAMFAQLMHAGALSQSRPETIAPSAVTPKGAMMAEYRGSGPFPRPRAMRRADIEAALDAFAAAARRAVAAGFDGVELHGANGYLIDQFLTAELNRRSDEYGGAMAARARFACEALAAVRAAVPAGLPVGIRVSQGKVNDHRYRWPNGRRDAVDLFTALAHVAPDFVHVASEGRPWTEDAILDGGASATGLARDILGVPVIANGGLHDPDLAGRVLDDRGADLVSIGRGALANPDWPARLRSGAAMARFDPAMLSPLADLASAAAWRARRGWPRDEAVSS